LAVLRLKKRSMMSANPRMEQAISGHMGQPAACMMVSKTALRNGKTALDYGLPTLHVTETVLPTFSVDNFVKNHGAGTRKFSIGAARVGLMEN